MELESDRISTPGGELGLFGKYRLLDTIATGRRASLYRAKLETVASSRLLALKCVSTRLGNDERLAGRFVRAAARSSLLKHSAACRIYEVGRTAGSLFVAMELVTGKDLGSVLSRVREARRDRPEGDRGLDRQSARGCARCRAGALRPRRSELSRRPRAFSRDDRLRRHREAVRHRLERHARGHADAARSACVPESRDRGRRRRRRAQRRVLARDVPARNADRPADRRAHRADRRAHAQARPDPAAGRRGRARRAVDRRADRAARAGRKPGRSLAARHRSAAGARGVPVRRTGGDRAQPAAVDAAAVSRRGRARAQAGRAAGGVRAGPRAAGAAFVRLGRADPSATAAAAQPLERATHAIDARAAPARRGPRDQAQRPGPDAAARLRGAADGGEDDDPAPDARSSSEAGAGEQPRVGGRRAGLSVRARAAPCPAAGPGELGRARAPEGAVDRSGRVAAAR